MHAYFVRPECLYKTYEMLPAPATLRGIFNNNRDSIAVNLNKYQGRVLVRWKYCGKENGPEGRKNASNTELCDGHFDVLDTGGKRGTSAVCTVGIVPANVQGYWRSRRCPHGQMPGHERA